MKVIQYTGLTRIKFRYKDELSHGQWRYQECVVRGLQECIELYGLGKDCEYEILDVEILTKITEE